MISSIRTLAAGMSLLALAACGGGSSSSPAPSAPSAPNTGAPIPVGNASGTSDNSWLQFTPSSLSFTQYVSADDASIFESTNDFRIVAKASKTIPQNVNVGIVDSTGILTTGIKFSQYVGNEYRADLHTSPKPEAGVHTGKIEVRLCEDSPVICAKPISGSPWFIPITVKVLARTDLRPLSTPAAARPWSTLGGNAAHSGYIPESFDVNVFARRWAFAKSTKYGLADIYIGGDRGSEPEAAIADGLVFLMTSGQSGGETSDWTLRALSEDTGAEVWKTSLGKHDIASSPAASNGKVYVNSSVYSTRGYQTHFWTFDQKTGALLGKRLNPAMTWNFGMTGNAAPTPFGDGVFGALSHQGGLYKADAMTGASKWMTPLRYYLPWTPAVDGKFAYAYQGANSVAAYNIADGSEAFVINRPAATSDVSMYTPVLGEGGRLFATEIAFGGYVLKAFDMTQRTPIWQLDDVASRPVVANGVVYFMRGKNVVAVDATTGATRWTLAFAGTFRDASLVVTDNLLFISGAFDAGLPRTAAVDLTSHKEVWYYLDAGRLSLSDRGVLYIARSPGNGLIAINLK